MSLGIDSKVNTRLKKQMKDMNHSVEQSRQQPDIVFRKKQGEFILPGAAQEYPPLALVKKADKQLAAAAGIYDSVPSGGNIFKDIEKGAKKATKVVKKTANKVAKVTEKDVKKVAKVAKPLVEKSGKELVKYAKSDAGKKMIKSVAKAGLSAAVLAVAPEAAPFVVPVIAGAGEITEEEPAKKAKKVKDPNAPPKVKKVKDPNAPKRPPSAWILHVKAHAKEHNVPYKQAMKDGKATYKK
tara:strand:+ start:5344 stop:6063 length:720 start_codon:yes stop_codon:yes gene_type:complete